MAVRLQMKLGVVPAPDRLPDSPDTVVVVEPTIGAVARSKGSLFLLVTSRLPGGRAREATRLAAETIRDVYYYDESAGIRVCLEKAVSLANKKLGHQRDRFGLRHEPVNGPIGVAVAVVRGSEMYVATVGPAEAYLIRGARLSTLPDPHRERGLPTTDLEPDVWRGEIAVGDSLVLVSPNVVARLGAEELKDAMVTLHPQSAMEHLHHAFVTAGGTGSDGAIAFEASEVAATHRQRSLVPVRAEEPLAGAPDRSPIPLADSLTGGVAAVQASATRARVAAGGVAGRTLGRFQDLLPRRNATGGRVTPYSARRETQRRAAVALLAFVVVVGGLGLGLSMLSGSATPRSAISSLTVGQRALQAARDDVDKVFGPGVNLTIDDPSKATGLLADAMDQIQTAESNGIPTGTTASLRTQIVTGLNTLSRMVDVNSSTVFAFPADAKADLVGLVIGSDGAPYVLDKTSQTVYRIDLKAKDAKPILRAGQSAKGTKATSPKQLVTGCKNVLTLDAKNVLWRWRPANTSGRGTLTRIPIRDASGWGSDVTLVNTFAKNCNADIYNLYVVDPSEQQILSYAAAADGSGYPAAPNRWLSAPRDVSTFTSMYIDGDLLRDGCGYRAALLERAQ